MNKANSLMVFGTFLLILVLGFASANTLIAGKIYNSDYSDTVSGVSVIVECDSESVTVTTLSDGTFGVVFGVNSCTNVDITTDSDYKVTDIEKNIPTNAPPTDGSRHSSSSGHSYTSICGNDKCDSDETSQTCPTDCPLAVENNTNETVTNINNAPEESATLSDVTGSNSGITGAVTGTSGDKKNLITLLAVLLFLAIAIALFFLIRKNRKKEQF